MAREFRNIPKEAHRAASRVGGWKGGRRTADRYGKAFCEARSSKGGNACLAKYGSEFFRYIRQLGIKKNKQNSRTAEGL